MLLGSSAAELARRVTVPLAVVRDVADRARAVIIGVDSSAAGDHAIRAGLDFAARHHLAVCAVHAWSDLPLEALGLRPDQHSGQARHEASALIAERLAAARRWYPHVHVDEVVVLDRPTGALLDRAAGAALLVVGRHGRAEVAGPPLGSVCHAVLHYAPCPVMLVG